MTRAEEVVKKVSGLDYKTFYPVLCCALEVVTEQIPRQLCMNDIVAKVSVRTGMKPTAVSKAISRATTDIWDNGNRAELEKIYGHSLASDKKPLPRELVLKLAQYMAKPVEYRLWEEGHSGRFGIAAADPVTGHWIAIAPFCPEQLRVEDFICFLNRIHAPLDTFQDLFFESGLLEII